jgi:3-oxoacyl-[acyl-carrier-protein] synthase II
MRRVVITGMGAVTPLGVGVSALWKGLTSGNSAVRPITRFDATRHRSRIAAEVKDFDPLVALGKKDALRMDLFVQYAVVAAQEAMTDAGLIPLNGLSDRTGVIVGTGMGGVPKLIETYEILQSRGAQHAVPYMLPALIPNMAAGWISMRFNARGPNSAVGTACAAGTHAIGDAFRVIQRGEADVMLAGGSESVITPVVFYAFDSLRARGIPIYGEISGYAMTADAHHPTAPAVGGEGAARCMRLALADARVEAGDVDYVSAHGTSTSINDASETQAIKHVFGARAAGLAVSSIKSMIGHLLGASGAVAAIATIMAIREGIVPPTINYEMPDPDCDLDYVPNSARRMSVKTALVNAFAFGGTNAVLVLRTVDGF